jgi:hypothetical protein
MGRYLIQGALLTSTIKPETERPNLWQLKKKNSEEAEELYGIVTDLRVYMPGNYFSVF